MPINLKAKLKKLKKVPLFLLARIKKIKLYQYLYIAIFIHILLIIWFHFIMVIAPRTHKVLFKSKMVGPSKEAPAPGPPQKKVIKASPVATKIPAKIVPAPPEAKKRIAVKSAPKAVPVAATKMVDIKPEGLKLAKTTKIGAGGMGGLTGTGMGGAGDVRQFARGFGISGKGKNVKAAFTAVLAQYAGGNWNMNPTALPNLMLETTRRTNVNVPMQPITVRVDSQEIYKSPFVFFTGTQDFTLTQSEVEGLRKYILQGGYVWADNGLPGKRSRFDVAFRREMDRVLPEYKLEPIPDDHPILQSSYRLKKTPTSMNWRNDPPEIIRIHGRTAVIYTLNSYGDLWESRLDEDGKVDHSFSEGWRERLSGPHWPWDGHRWEYDNVSQESVEEAYQLGVNIITFLLQELGSY